MSGLEMTKESENGGQESTDEKYQSGRLRAFVEEMKWEFGDQPELIKQSLADLYAIQHQNSRNNFEARQEYVKQVADLKHLSLSGIREYGLQTLKWLFLLNAGAIAVVLAYVGAATGNSQAQPLSAFAPELKALWPFAFGCVCVVLSGAASFFNFSYEEGSLPSAEALYNFLNPGSFSWPLARLQEPNESAFDFHKRVTSKTGTARYAAIMLATTAGLSFIYGVYRVLHAALG
jgi:hypothetical protein